MDEKYYLIKKVYYALLSSQPILNDEELFDSMSSALCDGVSNKLSVVFGKSKEEEFISDDKSRQILVLFTAFCFLILSSYSSFLALILMMRTRHFEKLSRCMDEEEVMDGA